MFGARVCSGLLCACAHTRCCCAGLCCVGLFWQDPRYPLSSSPSHREVDLLPAVKALAEPAVVGLWVGHHKLPGLLL